MRKVVSGVLPRSFLAISEGDVDTFIACMEQTHPGQVTVIEQQYRFSSQEQIAVEVDSLLSVDTMREALTGSACSDTLTTSLMDAPISTNCRV